MPDTGGFFRGTAGCTRMQYNCKKETTGMDTFEKIRALLAEQLDVDPAKINHNFLYYAIGIFVCFRYFFSFGAIPLLLECLYNQSNYDIMRYQLRGIILC